MNDDDDGDDDDKALGVTRYACMPSLITLQQMRNRLHLAHLGRKLMKWTSQATLRELRKITIQIMTEYEGFKESIREAFILLARSRYCQPIMNKIVLENIPKTARFHTKTSMRSVAGVKLYVLQIVEDKLDPFSCLGLGLGGENITKARKAWSELLRKMVHIAELRRSFHDVDEANKSATKKMNVIKRILTPKLKLTIGYILSELEEREREETFRLKQFKKGKDKKNKNNDTCKTCTCCRDKLDSDTDFFPCDKEKKKENINAKSYSCNQNSQGTRVDEVIGCRQDGLVSKSMEKVINTGCVAKDKIEDTGGPPLCKSCKEEMMKQRKRIELPGSPKSVKSCSSIKTNRVNEGSSRSMEKLKNTCCVAKKKVEEIGGAPLCKSCKEEMMKQRKINQSPGSPKSVKSCASIKTNRVNEGSSEVYNLASESCEKFGYFEKKFKEIVKVTRLKNYDGTVSEEKQVITIRTERRNPKKPCLGRDSSSCLGPGGHDGDSAKNFRCPRNSKSEHTGHSNNMGDPKLRTCMSCDFQKSNNKKEASCSASSRTPSKASSRTFSNLSSSRNLKCQESCVNKPCCKSTSSAQTCCVEIPVQQPSNTCSQSLDAVSRKKSVCFLNTGTDAVWRDVSTSTTKLDKTIDPSCYPIRSQSKVSCGKESKDPPPCSVCCPRPKPVRPTGSCSSCGRETKKPVIRLVHKPIVPTPEPPNSTCCTDGEAPKQTDAEAPKPTESIKDLILRGSLINVIKRLILPIRNNTAKPAESASNTKIASGKDNTTNFRLCESCISQLRNEPSATSSTSSCKKCQTSIESEEEELNPCYSCSSHSTKSSRSASCKSLGVGSSSSQVTSFRPEKKRPCQPKTCQPFRSRPSEIQKTLSSHTSCCELKKTLSCQKSNTNSTGCGLCKKTSSTNHKTSFSTPQSAKIKPTSRQQSMPKECCLAKTNKTPCNLASKHDCASKSFRCTSCKNICVGPSTSSIKTYNPSKSFRPEIQPPTSKSPLKTCKFETCQPYKSLRPEFKSTSSQRFEPAVCSKSNKTTCGSSKSHDCSSKSSKSSCKNCQMRTCQPANQLRGDQTPCCQSKTTSCRTPCPTQEHDSEDKHLVKTQDASTSTKKTDRFDVRTLRHLQSANSLKNQKCPCTTGSHLRKSKSLDENSCGYFSW